MELYSVVKCVDNPSTGCGIIMNVQPIPECRYGMYLTTCMYAIVTDFGNKVWLTQEELDSYELLYVESDPKGRLETQIRKLRVIKGEYFGGKDNGL